MPRLLAAEAVAVAPELVDDVPVADRGADERVVRARGGGGESDFAARFAANARLARALFALR